MPRSDYNPPFRELQDDVAEFMDRSDQPRFTLADYRVGFSTPNIEMHSPRIHGAFAALALGRNLIYEEVVTELIRELDVAHNNFKNGVSARISTDSLDKIADGCIDSIYVLLWLLNAMGYKGQPYWDEVQRANMSKINPETGKVTRREDGKILKPVGWVGPKTREITEAQINFVEEFLPTKDTIYQAKDKFQSQMSESIEQFREFVSYSNDMASALQTLDKDNLEKEIMQMQLTCEVMLDSLKEAEASGVFNK